MSFYALFCVPLLFVHLFILLFTISLHCFSHLQTVDNSVVRIIPQRQTRAEDLTRSPENELFSKGKSSLISRGNSFGHNRKKSSNGKF